MTTMRLPHVLGCAVLIAAGSPHVQAQAYPDRPIRIVTANPGGGNDLLARLLQEPLSAATGQPVVIDNRGGGNGENTMRAVMSQPPDGYTLLVYSSGLWIAPLIQKVSWDPVKDFAPVIWMAKAPNVLVVHPSLPVRSVPQLVSLAKARPGELNYASGQLGAGTHLCAELLKAMAGVNIVRVVYKGTGAGVIATASGEMQLMFPAVGAVTSFLRSKKLRALAVTGAEPSRLLPGLPTMAEAGNLPGYESEAHYGVFAPVNTPAAVIDRLNAEILKILSIPAVEKRFFASGIEAVGGSPGKFDQKIRSDLVKWGKIIRDAGIEAR